MHAESGTPQGWREQLRKTEKLPRSWKTDPPSSDQLRNYLSRLQPEERDPAEDTEYVAEIPEKTHLLSDAKLVLE